MKIPDIRGLFPGPEDSIRDARKRVEEFGAHPPIDQSFLQHIEMLSDAYLPDFMGGRQGIGEMRQRHVEVLKSAPCDLAVTELRPLGHEAVTSVDAGKANRAVPDPAVLAFAPGSTSLVDEQSPTFPSAPSAPNRGPRWLSESTARLRLSKT